SGVDDWKNDKNLKADRCASWMDGRHLQGTFTATRQLNDEKPDVTCAGAGGLSGARAPRDTVSILMCDGSGRTVTKKLSLNTWQLLGDRNDGQPIPGDF